VIREDLTMGLMSSLSDIVLGNLEKLFYWWGLKVTRFPFTVIVSCIVITGIFSLGYLKFSQEHRANLLWIPADSEFNKNQRWLDQHFRKNTRANIVIFQADNVLQPYVIQKMLELYNRISSLNVDGKSFEDICTRVSIADIFQTKRKKREVESEEEEEEDYYDFWADEYDDYSLSPVISSKPRIDFDKYRRNGSSVRSDTADSLPRSIFCDLVNTLSTKCGMSSLLEMWRYEGDIIGTTTEQEILEAVNDLTHSPWYGYNTDYTSLLGGVERDQEGRVVRARTALMVWSLTVPDEVELDTSQGSGVELELADPTTLAWEKSMIETTLNMTAENITILLNSARSYGDISNEAIGADMFLLFGGYLLMFLYTVVMLGSLNTVEIKLYLSMSGMVCIGMGISIAVSLSSAIGYFWTPMHPALPLLCLGIGIDDMFVIMQSVNNVKKDPTLSYLSTEEKIALSLKHAGVSVTVTSVTDVFAFAVGSVTNMPGLESFCVTVAIGLGSIYLLMVSWFTAWLTLDERRIEASQDGIFPCITHKDFSPGETSLGSWTERVKTGYISWLSSPVYKALVVLTALGLLVSGVWGWVNIKQIFNPSLMMPSDSYLRQWIRVHETNYPQAGWDAQVYSAHLDQSDLRSIDSLVTGLEELETEGTYVRSVDCWWKNFKQFTKEKTNLTSWTDLGSDFSIVLSDFLFSSYGGQYRSSFKFSGELQCSQPAPNITASKFSLSYVRLNTPDQHIPARKAVRRVIEEAASPYNFSHVKIYASWETDIIIGGELWRNLGLSITCVVFVTFLLLCNIQICLMVVFMVTLSLTDIIGFLHFWNITIDIISCINIVLAVGLCVDYSVHIGHSYLVSKGDRLEKTTSALLSIGPAVLNGGLTTFLALALCSLSTGHVFLTFFKVFTLTVVFGLYHGLVVFPVILATFGPQSEQADTPTITFSVDKPDMKRSKEDDKNANANLGFEEDQA